MCDKKFYYKLGENIRGLRRAYGETQLDLAIAIDVKPNTISNYEMGERLPERTLERDVLIRIAKHYMVTEDDLLNGDFSKTKKIKNYKINDIAIKRECFERCFPIVCSKEAMGNENFRLAYDLHMNLYHKILRNEAIKQEEIEECERLYNKASEEKVEEARANLLWWTIIFSFAFSIMNSKIIDMIEMSNINNINAKDFVQMILPTFYEDIFDSEQEKEIREEKKKYYEDKIVDSIVNIRLLKLSEHYSDLGDYYMALSYLVGLVPNETTKETNLAMGAELMSVFSIMGNEYARNFFKQD